jgi:hypothetical protein
MHTDFSPKTEGKRPLRISQRIWEVNIEMVLKEAYMKLWTGLNWLRIQWSVFIAMVMELWIP